MGENGAWAEQRVVIVDRGIVLGEWEELFGEGDFSFVFAEMGLDSQGGIAG